MNIGRLVEWIKLSPRGLVAERILFRASSLGQSFDYFAYNIQLWVGEYLNKHPKLLS